MSLTVWVFAPPNFAVMGSLLNSLGQDAVLGSAVRLLTPPLCDLYAVLVRTGVVVIVDD